METLIREVRKLRIPLKEERAEENHCLVLEGKEIKALIEMKTAQRNGDVLDRPVGTSHLRVMHIEVVEQLQIV